jgi:hypothetical protein
LQSDRGAIRAGMHGLIRAGDGNRTDLFVGGGQRALMERGSVMIGQTTLGVGAERWNGVGGRWKAQKAEKMRGASGEGLE